MRQIGFAPGQYVIRVSSRKLLDGLLESIGLGGEQNASRRLVVLRAIDKIDRFETKGVQALLGAGRKDESGDFTPGAKLTDDQIRVVIQFVMTTAAYLSPDSDFEPIEDDASIPHTLNNVEQPPLRPTNFGLIRYLGNQVQSELYQEGIRELEAMAKIWRACGYGTLRIMISPGIVRGLEYYTGPVFEADMQMFVRNEQGQPVRFGSVGGGGRYDGLVSRFRGEPVPATGFSIGVSRLQAALTLIGKLGTQAETGPVVVTVFDRDRIADYQTMVSTLRAANIRAELYLGNPKNNLGVQFKYADKRNSPCAIIQGSDEKAKGEVQIKDLIEGAKAAAAIASNQEWRETRPAQFACKESELVEKVREVLARHGLLHPSP
jgi:histidyl-tRNA synthetase